MLEFKSTIEFFDNNVYGLHVPVPDEINQHFAENFNDKRVLFGINGSEKRPGGIMKCAEYYYLLVNKQTVSQLKLAQGMPVSITIEKDLSEYGMEMPEEMRMVMDQDEMGSKYFHQLTPGKQRNLIYIVSKVKSSDKRINKSLAIMEHLNEVKGEIEFRKLNDTIKKYNNIDRAWF